MRCTHINWRVTKTSMYIDRDWDWITFYVECPDCSATSVFSRRVVELPIGPMAWTVVTSPAAQEAAHA